jgi:hypothetical protein
MMFDITLFTRTLSQALQASLAIAFCLCWAERMRQQSILSGLRRGVAAAVPATVIATWLFAQTSYQARWEAALAAIALAAVAWFARAVWLPGAVPAARTGTRVVWLCAIAAIVLIVRQTMEIGVMLRAAIVEVRSIEAVAAVAGGTAAGFLASGAWIWIGRRLSHDALLTATRVFTVLFAAQVAFYGLHEASEAQWLPWSEFLHAATEPYGPDSSFGMYATPFVLLVPAAVAAAMFARERRVDPVAGLTSLATLAVGLVAGVMLSSTGVPSRAAGGGAMTGSAAPLAVSHDPESFVDAPHIVFTHTRHDADYGRVAVARFDAPDAARATAPLTCRRVSFGLDSGVCIRPRESTTDQFDAVIFDAAFRPVHTLPLTGSPSRTRASIDGRYGSVTTFLTGQSHGYASADLSTETLLLDMRGGTVIANLEAFTTFREDKPFKEADFNFWGVTFSPSDSNTFYATLRTGTRNYLVRGDIGKRTTTVIADDVECPSLSPDERSIAFKRRVSPMPTAWRVHVLDLATMTDRPVAAANSYVDDQVEWLDSRRILYALPHLGTADVWVAPIDGTEPARILMHDAESPIVVRHAGPANRLTSAGR